MHRSVLACGEHDVPGGRTLRYRFEGYCLDTDRRELKRGAAPVPVEPQVFDILSYLIRNRERVVSRDELIAAIWDGRIVSESALTTRINGARSAIGDNGQEQRLIKTFPRKGVRFVGIVHEQQSQVGQRGAETEEAQGDLDLAGPALDRRAAIRQYERRSRARLLRRRYDGGSDHRPFALHLAFRDRAQLIIHLQGQDR